MNVLFLSRKKLTGIGGLSRFAFELTQKFQQQSLCLSPDNLLNIFKLGIFKPDLIHLCDATLLPIGVILKLIFRKPLFVSAHGLDLTYPNLIYQKMLKFLLPFVNGVILDSQASLSLVNKFKVPKDLIWVINPGICLKHFGITKSTQRRNLEQKIILLSVGNLVKRKGHFWFIKNVFHKLPQNYIYQIVGDGEEKELIQDLISKLDLKKRVFLLGRLTDKELGGIFRKADIYISPNQKVKNNFESFGIANGEAAGLGLPVVASNVDGISEIIKDHKNGLLVRPQVKYFLSSIKKLKNNNFKNQLKRQAKKYTIQNFSWTKTASLYKFVFRELSGKNLKSV